MTTPMTYETLPPHRKLALSEQERADLPMVEWDAYTAPRFQHLKSTNALGTWFIGHQSQNSSGTEPVEISYQMPMEEGEDYAELATRKKEIDFDDVRAWEIWAKMSKQDIGYAFNQDYAMLFVEKALRQVPGSDPEQILLAAGFRFEHEMAGREPGAPPTRVFRKDDDKRGCFSVMMSANSLWLMHEKRSATSWENLLMVHTCTEGSSKQVIPHFISPHVDNIIAAAAEMSGYFVQNWKPAPPRARAKRRSP